MKRRNQSRSGVAGMWIGKTQFVLMGPEVDVNIPRFGPRSKKSQRKKKLFLLLQQNDVNKKVYTQKRKGRKEEENMFCGTNRPKEEWLRFWKKNEIFVVKLRIYYFSLLRLVVLLADRVVLLLFATSSVCLFLWCVRVPVQEDLISVATAETTQQRQK